MGVTKNNIESDFDIIAAMKARNLSRYISILFIVATFMGVFHHHNDLASHNDCQICTLQNTIADADTPTEVCFLSKIEIYSLAITSQLPVLHQKYPLNILGARAPPHNS